MIELVDRDERILKEMSEALERAKEKAAECDSILILMQRKDGDLIYEAPGSMRVETLSFLATSFLHGFHAQLRTKP